MQNLNFLGLLALTLFSSLTYSCSKTNDLSEQIMKNNYLDKDLVYQPGLEIMIPFSELGQQVKNARNAYENTDLESDIELPIELGIWNIEAYLNNKYGSASFKFSEIVREVTYYDLGVNNSKGFIQQSKISIAIQEIAMFINDSDGKIQLPATNKSVYYINIKPYKDNRNHVVIKALVTYGVVREITSNVGQLILRQDCLSTYQSKFAFGSMGVCDDTPTGYTLGYSVSPWDGGEVVERVVTNKLRLQDNYDCIYSSPLPSYPAGCEYYNLDTDHFEYPFPSFSGTGSFANTCLVRADYISFSNELTDYINDEIDTNWPSGSNAADIDMYSDVLISGGSSIYKFTCDITGEMIGEF